MGVSLNKCPTVLAAGGGHCLAALAECQQQQQFLHGRLPERQGTAFRHTRRDYGGRLHGGEGAYLRFMCRGRAENTPGGTAGRCREATV